jgi:hypothetical protein
MEPFRALPVGEAWGNKEAARESANECSPIHGDNTSFTNNNPAILLLLG